MAVIAAPNADARNGHKGKTERGKKNQDLEAKTECCTNQGNDTERRDCHFKLPLWGTAPEYRIFVPSILFVHIFMRSRSF
ncbi:MAG TPA: hypothetical protein VLJ17_24180 [Xanthobacteraceae bacterium]|nr:hypothetical protein [Xanthobacteraceae bacterium]